MIHKARSFPVLRPVPLSLPLPGPSPQAQPRSTLQSNLPMSHSFAPPVPPPARPLSLCPQEGAKGIMHRRWALITHCEALRGLIWAPMACPMGQNYWLKMKYRFKHPSGPKNGFTHVHSRVTGLSAHQRALRGSIWPCDNYFHSHMQPGQIYP